MSSHFEAWGAGDAPPLIGGKHGFKLKDLKAGINAGVKRMGIENHSWRGRRVEQNAGPEAGERKTEDGI